MNNRSKLPGCFRLLSLTIIICVFASCQEKSLVDTKWKGEIYNWEGEIYNYEKRKDKYVFLEVLSKKQLRITETDRYGESKINYFLYKYEKPILKLYDEHYTEIYYYGKIENQKIELSYYAGNLYCVLEKREIFNEEEGEEEEIEKNRKKLHQSLRRMYPVFKRTYDEFVSDMQDEKKRKRLHSNLKIDLGFTRTYDEFNSDMGFFLNPPAKDSEHESLSYIEDKPLSTDVRLQTGSSPYDKYFGLGMKDFESLSEITVQNGTNQDAVVIFINTYSDKCMRNVYIRANSSYTIKQIPKGIYKMKCYYGNDWEPSQNNGTGFPVGGFKRNISFTTPSSSKDYFDMHKEETHNGYNYSTYTVTLHKVVDGNMQTKSISKNDFFNG
jgi:hypothetical protein